MQDFLPATKKEMQQRGWDQVDFVYLTGDAYVDHPSFGAAIISRLLESRGYRVGIIPQPDWRKKESVQVSGEPRLGFLVSAGNMDSMVNHYTVSRKHRQKDSYSPGGEMGLRPDMPTVVYSNLIRQTYKHTPIILGGIEASLRRLAHYDYWDDSVRQSILFDSQADILTYGMGENQTIEIAKRLAQGKSVKQLRDIKGICYYVPTSEYKPGPVVDLPSYERVCESKKEYAIAARKELEEADAVRGRTVIQRHGKYILVQNPPMPPLTTEELDWVYSLPYEKYYHPSYEALGGVPGIKEVEFSITHNRGCFGACNFCSIAFHQGRAITVRSKESVLDEARRLVDNPRFKGYIHDVGGPTANFRLPSCTFQKEHGMCKNKKCLAPKPCRNLQVNHEEYIDILREMRAIKGIKKVFIRSGIRFDYLMEDESKEFFHELVKYHVSGQLKVAPEHCSAAVLDKMGKPHIETYKRFQDEFYKFTKQVGKEQYLVPYLMSSHPGSTLKDAVELALFLKKEHIRPEQVQDFYPTPGTISTAMFYTELDPYTLEPVYVPKTMKEKHMQRALLQYFNPKNKEIVVEALRKAGRTDLIGNGKNCLVSMPQNMRTQKNSQGKQNNRNKNKNKNRNVNRNRHHNNHNRSGRR